MISPRTLRNASPAICCLLFLAACGSQLTEEELFAAAGVAQDGGAIASSVADGSTGAAHPGRSETADGGDSVLADSGGAGSAAAGGSGPTGDKAAAQAPGAAAGPEAGGGTPGAGGEAGCVGNKGTVKIGMVGQTSGIIGAVLVSGVRAVQAWVAEINARGGLSCHQIEYIVRDDGGDPSRHRAIVQELVESEGVIAFLHQNAVLTGQASVDYLTQKKIPVIGSEGIEPWFYESPMYFPQGSSGDLLGESVYWLGSTVADETGSDKMAMVTCIEASQCTNSRDKAPAMAKKYGLDLVYNGSASLAQPDFTSVCQQARSAGATMMGITLDGTATQRMGRSCDSIGYHPVFMLPSSASTPAHGEDPNLEGLVVSVPTKPWTSSEDPEVAEYLQALGRQAPGDTPDAAGIVGWTSAKLLERAARGLDDLTSETLLAGLWSLKADNLGGLTHPLTFTKGKSAPAKFCFWSVVAKGGGFQTRSAHTCKS